MEVFIRGRIMREDGTSSRRGYGKSALPRVMFRTSGRKATQNEATGGK